MNKVKVVLGSLAVISVLSLSGCCLLDPFWWADGPHGGGHYDRGYHDGGYHGGGHGGHGGDRD
ncbi:hypothetical protein [Acinetobacter sp. MB5]|uniref:hypothetical protein n=1 Tax=Acinetobacter sp. MB5 TaxID=2069438 RepID=UPI000DD09483|nr:hypothetical protein [Acinetobacter sp. MB5]